MEHLYPRNEELLRLSDEDDEEEADDEYQRRLEELLPNFPAQVIKDWIVRHGRSAFREHGWLDYRRFRFEQAQRPVIFFRNAVLTSNEPAVASWALAIRVNKGFQESDLGSYMLENGTWPVPPVILANSSGLKHPQGEGLGRHHLLEGHHRLAYLKGFATPPPIPTQERHSLWRVTYV
jgi:hypothetical protein